MKLVWIALFALAVPLIGWRLEERDPDRWEAARMADRDRRRQAVRPMNRRMKYARIEKPPLLAQRRQTKGQM